MSLHLAESAAITLAEPKDVETSELQREILVALAGGGAFFFRQLASAVGSMDDRELTTALWDLVWAGLVTNDTLAPLRSFLGGKAAPKRATRVRPRYGRAHPLLPSQSGPPTVAGRWSLLPLAEGDTTIRAKATAETLLERYGIVTRGAVVSEGIRGGFALTYKVLSSFEETGRARRGYFVDGLGGAQFATGATVDRLRQFARDDDAVPELKALTLAATDPANPYGAALSWPAIEGHRPGRKAGSLVVLVDGELAVYLERGGKTVLTFTTDEAMLAAAAVSLAAIVRTGLGKLRIERVNGDFSIGSPFGLALTDAGFAPTPRDCGCVPEGDTVFRAARRLNDALAGRVLDRCDIRVPAFATVDLSGERVHEVVSVGKHLLHRIGDFTIHSHLKMEGSWEVYPVDAKWRHPAWQARAILGVPGTLAIGFQLGELEIVPREREDDIVGYLGPDILGADWDTNGDFDVVLENLTADPDRAIGLALLDQRVVAGLGNVYRNELCFLRGVLPTRPVGEVGDPAAMLKLAHRAILANRDRPERTTTGDLRRGRRFWVHGRDHQPCRRCGTAIVEGSLGENELTQRNTFYCPHCQT